MVHSKNSVSTKVSKEIIPFQQECPTSECHAKNDPIALPKSDKKSNSTPKPLTTYDTNSATLVLLMCFAL